MLTIDTHTHYIPEQARQILTRAGNGSDGKRLATLASLPDSSPMFAIEERLSNMDRLGIDVGVVSPAPLDVLEDQGLAADLIQASNDGLLELCASHPDRFVMLASLPMPNAAASLAELNRIGAEPALRGITFPSQATLHRPDQIGIEPLLARAAELGRPLLLHPSGSSTDFGTVFDDFGLGLSFHAMISGPLVILRMIAAGIFDRVPGLQVIVPMFGGVLPYIGFRQDGRLKGKMERPPTDYMRSSIFFDTSGFPAGPTYRCAIETVGASHMILGSDYPSWDMGFVLTALSEMDLGQADREAILGGNASRWFDPQDTRQNEVRALARPVGTVQSLAR
jgi:predicted TIM-barrel fold metal-dependent hydrolase